MKAQPDVDSNSADAPFDRKAVLGDALRRRILSMELAPGAVVDELALCDEFGLAPAGARTAAADRRRGLHRTGSQPCAARRGHEPRLAARLLLAAPLIYIATTQLAATHASEAEIETLKAIQEDFRKAIEEKHVENRVIHNDAFHLEIGRMAHNDYLMPSLRRLLIDHARLGKIFYRHPTTDDMQRDLELACDQHDQIVDAIQRRDPDAAAEIVRAHFELSRRRMAEYAAPAGVEVALVYEG